MAGVNDFLEALVEESFVANIPIKNDITEWKNFLNKK